MNFKRSYVYHFISLLVVALIALYFHSSKSVHKNRADAENASTIYEFTANDIDGKPVSLEKYRGHVAIIVNVACECGFTYSNYQQLNALYDKYEHKGLRILAFPCNQFGGQEPGTESEIKQFMRERGVRFDAFSKIEVNGENAHPLFVFLKHKLGGTLGSFIKWNFTKFLVNREGVPVKRFGPQDEPLVINYLLSLTVNFNTCFCFSQSMEEDIKKLL
ncbi:glutathione peroxidase-like protein [Dinothrombium tinctorium]|uniref:Glutathione peroxidase n=1 Tax=Dinothrombium tinctorium TaxID=1965070 RepID=A0A3S3RKF1_9ACAR|nr:glutathione peroxidase-like protein [Dinothrombium tinctorium]RWS02314.1 glutathione peroxidase-like protein [Dinothrombium tinctorium]RWS07079.1 glutathione peroxidase-like protein [Dinothrombium tinctorium]